MTSSDCKFFLLIAVVGIAGFGLLFPWNWRTYPWVHRPDNRPTITFVPKGTPGAKTLEEWNREKRGWR